MRIPTIIIFVFNLSLLKSQSLELSNFKIKDSYSKDCDAINTCIDSIRLIDDSLFFDIYIKDQSRYTPERTLYHKMKDDTLSISYYSKPLEKDTIVYNEETNKCDTLKYITQSISLLNPLETACRIYLFEFSGVKKAPKFFVYNNEVISCCPVTDVSYLNYKGDKINIINKNGYKEGRWIEFYDTGEIIKIKNYHNGRFINGHMYDKTGKTTHILDEGYEEIAIPIEFYNKTHE